MNQKTVDSLRMTERLSTCCSMRHYHTMSVSSIIENVMELVEEEDKPQLVPDLMIYGTLALSVIGLWGNVFVVMSTILSKQLQNRCNMLIGILAGTDFVICVYLVQLRIFMMNRWYNVPNSHCFLASLHGVFALNVQAGMGLVLGVDRLLAMSVPLRYTQLPVSIYYCMVGTVLLYAAVITGYGFYDRSMTDVTAVCMPPTAYNNRSRMIWIGTNFVISVAVIIVYGSAHLKGRRLNEATATANSATSVARIRRLLNSLTIIICIYSLTWFITVLSLLVTQVFAKGTDFARFLEQQLAWLVIINASTNFFIYFWRAPEYRRAFVFLLSCGKCRELDGSLTRGKHDLRIPRNV